MERDFNGFRRDVVSLGCSLFHIVASAIKTLGTGLLVTGVFVVPFYVTTFVMCCCKQWIRRC